MSAPSPLRRLPFPRRLRLLLPGLLLLLVTACTLFPAATTTAPAAGKGSRKPLTATFLGNTTILIDDGKDQILIDGFLTRPGVIPSAIASLRTDTKTVDTALQRAGVDRLRAVFVTHSHIDHALDAAYVIHRSRDIQQTGAILYGSVSTYNIGRGGDLARKEMRVFQHSLPSKNEAPPKECLSGAYDSATGCETFQVRQFTIKVIPSVHSKPIPLVNNDLGSTIDEPLRQPAHKSKYAEGGSYDFLITHQRGQSILVKPSTGYLDGALTKADAKADVLFLGVSGLGRMSPAEREDLYRNTVQQVDAKRVIPIHWDIFFCPLSDKLPILFPLDQYGLQYLEQRLEADHRQYHLMQGYQAITIQ